MTEGSKRGWLHMAGFRASPLYWLLVMAVACLLICGLGCGKARQDKEGSGNAGEGWSGPRGEPAEGNGEGGEPESARPVPAGRTVHMCGRSVLAGWFEHWGWEYDPQTPVRFGSHYLIYHEMDVPPGIVDSARRAARATAEAGDGVMFFKLCFADFAGGDEVSARENLEENMRIVRAVVEAAVDEQGLALILGNALPMVREYTDEWLVWNHREYNRRLEELADAYGGRVRVLDLYGALSAPGGWLRPEYAADPYDSHLNRAAYEALDEVLADMLGG